MTITLTELAAWVLLPGSISIFLLLPFHLAWQLRLYFWPLVDRAELDIANACFRIRLIESAGHVSFTRTGLIERQIVSLACAARSLWRVFPFQLAICFVGAIVAFVVSKVVPLYFGSQVMSLFVPVYRFFLVPVTYLLIGVLMSISFIGISQLFAFCKIEKRPWLDALFSTRYMASLGVMTSLTTVLAIIFCFFDNCIFLDLHRALYLGSLSTPIVIITLPISLSALVIDFFSDCKVHPRHDYLFLSQPIIETSSISAKSDYELQKLIDAADTYRETEIAQWMREELLRRSDSLVQFEDLSVC